MQKFILGVISTLGVLGMSKMSYNKGRRDEAKQTCEYLDTAMKGVKIGRESKTKESE